MSKEIKKVSLSPEENLESVFDYLNTLHEKYPNVETGMIFCFHQFVQTVHPSSKDLNVFNDTEARDYIYDYYQKMATQSTNGRGVGYYQFDRDGQKYYLKVAFTDLANITDGIPEQSGFCAVCKKISYREYYRETKWRAKHEQTSIIGKISNWCKSWFYTQTN